MAWSTIREATQEDLDALNKAARRFAARHDLQDMDFVKPSQWYDTVDNAVEGEVSRHRDPNDIDHWYAMRLKTLWTRVVRRVLKHPTADGVAYGYVGWHVD